MMAMAEAMLDRLSGKTGRATVFVCLFAALLFLPGFLNLPPVDRDEALFAQASRQMAESGDLVDIRLGEGTRYKKPAGIYWLQAAALRIVGTVHVHDIWVYRLPSLAAAVAATGLTVLIGTILFGPPAGFLSGLLLATCFILGGEARLAKTDATLLAMVLAAQLVLARLHMLGRDGVRGAWPWLFWAALGAQVLIKGPVGPMVLLLTVLALVAVKRESRWLAALRPLPGIALLLAIALPWYIAITLKAGASFWAEALGRDLVGKIGTGQENHGSPPGTYLIAVWLTFWPAAILLPWGIGLALQSWRDPALRFCLAWIVPSWIVFELTATKLMHYTMPTYPALAILAAAGWLRRPEGRPGTVFQVFLAVMLALALVFAGISLGFSAKLGGTVTLPWIAGIAVTLTGITLVWISVRAGHRWVPALGFGALSLGFGLSLYGQLARVERLWPSLQMAHMAATSGHCSDPQIVSVSYSEPSLYLLTDRWPTFTDAEDAARIAISGACAVIFVSDGSLAAFDAARAGAHLQDVGTVEGFSIGNAREVRLSAFAVP